MFSYYYKGPMREHFLTMPGYRMSPKRAKAAAYGLCPGCSQKVTYEEGVYCVLCEMLMHPSPGRCDAYPSEEQPDWVCKACVQWG